MTLKETILLNKAHLKAGDLQRIANRANCSTQTVRNAIAKFLKGQPLTAKEDAAYSAFTLLAKKRKAEDAERRSQLLEQTK